MYKTVRQGENSLQYTILPQQDESTGSVGHKTSSGLCRSRPHRTKRGRTTTILIVTLILVCSIVAGSILVPLLMTTDMVAFRQLASQTTNPHVVVHHHRAAKVVRHGENATTTSTVATTPEDNFNTLTTGTNGGDVSNSSVVDDMDVDLTSTAKTDAETTQALTTAGTERVEVTSVEAPKQKKVNETTSSEESGGDGNVTAAVARVLGTTRIVVEATVAGGGGDRNWTEGPDVVIAKVTRPTVNPYRGWLPPRWPFADPSSYLQWTGYGTGHDSLLLPLLLGLVLIVLVLIIVFCYVMRRKHQKYLRREAIGKMSSDLQCGEAGDKSTLLPETNSEEE